jgi:hypothetical protein
MGRTLAMVLMVLGLIGLAGCTPAEQALTATASSQQTAPTTNSSSTTSTSIAPSAGELAVEDGAWDLRIDRRGGSEDADEAFGFLPEARYGAIEGGSTYHVVISDHGERVSVKGMLGGAHFFEFSGRLKSSTDEQAWYEPIDQGAGGRFVVWEDAGGLQGELTFYGSGVPIISSERGSLTRTPPGDGASTTTAALSEEGTAQAEAVLRAFFEAWAAKDVTAYKELLSERRRQEMGTVTFEHLDRIEFGSVVPAPEGIDLYVNFGRGYGMDPGIFRCFRASVTFYVKPRVVGTNVEGEEYPWMLWLVRAPDGRWGVDGWGV